MTCNHDFDEQESWDRARRGNIDDTLGGYMDFVNKVFSSDCLMQQEQHVQSTEVMIQ
jgi:hypothetical protein